MSNKRALVESIGKAVVVFLFLLVTTFVASADCDRNVTVLDVCCEGTQTWGWFYNYTNATPEWEYTTDDRTPLFNLSVDGVQHYGFCINYLVPLAPGNTFNASIYTAEPTCKNNSIAHILNNWTIDCGNCANVSAGQSAVWYFWYINGTFCNLSSPSYNHTATPTDPGWESYWIPNCTAHPLACDFINASINKSVPYAITLAPGSGYYPKGSTVELTATVSYCAGADEEVTVVFETDNGNISGSGTVYENATSGGIASATLVCDPSVDSANVTVRIKDMSWFRIIDPLGCPDQADYQPTLKMVNITDNAGFSFYEDTNEVPVLTLFGIAVLLGLLSVITAVNIKRKKE